VEALAPHDPAKRGDVVLFTKNFILENTKPDVFRLLTAPEQIYAIESPGLPLPIQYGHQAKLTK
jgi:hypothetical protein